MVLRVRGEAREIAGMSAAKRPRVTAPAAAPPAAADAAGVGSPLDVAEGTSTAVRNAATAFDGRGNYSMGLTDQLVFPELRADDVEFLQGMNICITFSNSDDEKSQYLLSEFGFPFKKK